MNANKGTPKSLKEAVFNAFEENGTIVSEKLLNSIVTHLRDYMSQKFQLYWDVEAEVRGVTMLPVRTLWEKIIGGLK
jgi:hypothetical protein